MLRKLHKTLDHSTILMYGAAHGYAPDYITNLWLHWHQLRRAGHIFALPTASPSTSLGRGQLCTLGRWSTRLERTSCWHMLCTKPRHF